MKKQIGEKDIPAIIHRALLREAELLVKAIRALRRDIGSKRRQLRRAKFGF